MLFSEKFFSFIDTHTQQFNDPNLLLEQYATPTCILNKFFSFIPDFNDKNVLDLGTGLGTLAFSASWLGAHTIIGIDSDEKAIKRCRQNTIYFHKLFDSDINKNHLKIRKIPNFIWIYSLIEFLPIREFKNFIDVVLINPPFGTQRSGIDFVFLSKAFELNCPIISIHKENLNFTNKIQNKLKKVNYKIQNEEYVKFPLKKTMKSHKSSIYHVNTRLYFFTPIG